MKSYIPLILIMAVLMGFIVWVFFYTTSSIEIKNGEHTIGIIIGFEPAGKTSGRNAVIEYTVDGIRYETNTTTSAYKVM